MKQLFIISLREGYAKPGRNRHYETGKISDLVDDILNLNLLAVNFNLRLNFRLALIFVLLELGLNLMLEGVRTSLSFVLSLFSILPLRLLVLSPFLLNFYLSFDFDFSLGLSLCGLESNRDFVVFEIVAELQLGCRLVNIENDLKVASKVSSSDSVLEFVALSYGEGGFSVFSEALWGFGGLDEGGLLLLQTDRGICSDGYGNGNYIYAVTSVIRHTFTWSYAKNELLTR